MFSDHNKITLEKNNKNIIRFLFFDIKKYTTK